MEPDSGDDGDVGADVAVPVGGGGEECEQTTYQGDVQHLPVLAGGGDTGHYIALFCGRLFGGVFGGGICRPRCGLLDGHCSNHRGCGALLAQSRRAIWADRGAVQQEFQSAASPGVVSYSRGDGERVCDGEAQHECRVAAGGVDTGRGQFA